MRLSCNGCRVLRKGCSDDCKIRPCLQWIKSPQAQAYATVFLAKFYGRAGLVNLIATGPDDLRPAIFRSLLYEACGRMVNPVDGSVGLLWTGSWNLCQAAVDAVLKGEQITQVSSDTEAGSAAPLPPLNSFDIRHVNTSNRMNKVRLQFKRKRAEAEPVPSQTGVEEEENMESEGSHSHVSQGDLGVGSVEDGEVGLELTLGLEPHPAVKRSRCVIPRLMGLAESLRVDL